MFWHLKHKGKNAWERGFLSKSIEFETFGALTSLYIAQSCGKGWNCDPLWGHAMQDITLLLERAGTGAKPQEEILYGLVHTELRRLARSAMRSERTGHTLQPTALVNEAYLRLVGAGPVSWQNRAHFYHAAAQMMRRILIDYARTRQTRRRPGERLQVELQDGMAFELPQADQMVILNEALDQLHEISPRCAKIVEFRFFAGLSVEETAEVMSLSPKTVKRESQFARVWLEKQLLPHGAIQ